MKQCKTQGCLSTDLATRSALCKTHHNEYTRTHYLANKQKYLDKAKRHRDDNLAIIREAKSSPCMDCGVNYPYYVMDFDHRVDKEFTLAKYGNMGKKQIIDEIAKCDVVCANCHRERTALRAGYNIESVLE